MALQFKGGKATPVNAKKPAPFMRQPVLKLGDGLARWARDVESGRIA